MAKILDAVDAVNLFGRLEAALFALTSIQHRKRRKRVRKLVGNAQITFPRDHGLCGNDVAEHLRRYGIQPRAMRTRSDDIVMYVKRSQLRWARYVLRQLEAGHSPPAWAEQPKGGRR